MRARQVILPVHHDWRSAAGLDGRTGISAVVTPECCGRQVTVKLLLDLRHADRVDSSSRNQYRGDWQLIHKRFELRTRLSRGSRANRSCRETRSGNAHKSPSIHILLLLLLRMPLQPDARSDTRRASRPLLPLTSNTHAKLTQLAEIG